MDQFSTEEEQIEAVKKFWKDNGIPIVVGAALGLGGLWGWRFYHDQQLVAQSQASDAYNTAIEALSGDNADLTTVQSFVDGNSETVYAVMAALRMAKAAVTAKDLEGAEKQLSWASENVADASLRDLALVRLARVQSELEKHDVALATLDKVTSDAFQAQAFRVRGDVQVKQQQYAAAQESYTKALELADGDQSVLQMKIDHLNAKVSS